MLIGDFANYTFWSSWISLRTSHEKHEVTTRNELIRERFITWSIHVTRFRICISFAAAPLQWNCARTQVARINVPVIECQGRILRNGGSSVGSFQSITNWLELIGKVKFNFSNCACKIFHSARQLDFNNANRERKYIESKSSVGGKKHDEC